MNSTFSLAQGAPHLRFFAKILDELILLAVLYPLVRIMGGSAITVVMLFLGPVLYHAYTHASRAQATPGEHIMKLYVITTTGERLSLRRSLERSLAYTIPSLPIYATLSQDSTMLLMMLLVLIWFGPILVTRHARGLHDILCDARVVSGRMV